MGRLPMGELEAAVMDVPLAYTIVTTILVRLWQKGRVKRERDGRAFAYRPLQSREEHAATRMSDFLTATRDRPLALTHFLEALSPDDRAQLRRMLRGRSGGG